LVILARPYVAAPALPY